MKSHRIQPINQKRKSEVPCQILAFAVAKTMDSVVKAVTTDSMFADTPEGNARYIYFGRTQGNIFFVKLIMYFHSNICMFFKGI